MGLDIFVPSILKQYVVPNIRYSYGALRGIFTIAR